MDIIHPFGKEKITVTGTFCGQEITFEAGDWAFQADAAIRVRVGDTVVMGIGQVSDRESNLDYFPLMIDYEEKFYAAGKISGSRFVKREGRPTDNAVQISRLIDRPIRPLFPKNYKQEVQGIAMVLSLDPKAQPDVLSMISISAALNASKAPFLGPIGCVRVGLINDELVCNPGYDDMADSKLDLIVAGTKEAIMMVEAGADEVDEETLVKALELAHKEMQVVIDMQIELAEKLGTVKAEVEEEVEEVSELQSRVEAFVEGKMGSNLVGGKDKRDAAISDLKEALVAELLNEDDEDYADQKHELSEIYGRLVKKDLRRMILDESTRPDGRKPEEIRPLSSQVSVLPRTHGSSVFTRGTTQALNVVTLAPLSYSQMLDSMDMDDVQKRYMHHYNMPGFTVGEVQRPRSAGRREIGHGLLAERAILPMLPDVEEFPYAIRSVSELLSSNGSTSMASTCSSCLALMDAGVPLKAMVSGIAMGLLIDSEDPSKYVVLSDIQGAEDFAGDMDFKVTGTAKGVTALQMDIKVTGLTTEIMADALNQAKPGRMHILEHMQSVIDSPAELSQYAPRIDKLQIDPEMIGKVIGKGGETIQEITKETGAEIDIEDSGLIMISSNDADARDKAIKWIKDLTAVPEVGAIYAGKVVKILEFGAFVEFMPGQDGMVHISEIQDERVENINDVLSEGQEVDVKLTAIDDRGRMNLSIKKAKQ